MIEPRQRAHERAIRAEGFADYAITPPGERAIFEHRSPGTVCRTQPEGLRLRHVLPNRCAARPWHAPATAANRRPGRVTLVQEDEQNAPGFLIYVPVYRKDHADEPASSSAAPPCSASPTAPSAPTTCCPA